MTAPTATATAKFVAGAAHPPTPSDLSAIETLAALRGIEEPDWPHSAFDLQSWELGTPSGFDHGLTPIAVGVMFRSWVDATSASQTPVSTGPAIPTVVWHATLWELVHAYLVPEMGVDAPVLRFDSDGCQNPVRAWHRAPEASVMVDWMTVFAQTIHVLNRISGQHPRRADSQPSIHA